MKRRKWKPEQKALIVLEELKGRSIAEDPAAAASSRSVVTMSKADIANLMRDVPRRSPVPLSQADTAQKRSCMALSGVWPVRAFGLRLEPRHALPRPACAQAAERSAARSGRRPR